MSDMKEVLEQIVSRTIVSIEVHKAYDDFDASFTLHLDDGSKLYVSSRGFTDGSSIATIDYEE